MKVINLTPHSLHFIGEDGEVFLTLASEGLARVSTDREPAGTMEIPPDCPDGHSDEHKPGSKYLCGACGGQKWVDISLSHVTFGDVEGLPEPIDYTIYVVSSIVASAVPDRQDVWTPGDLVRDDDGRIIGCRGLSRRVEKEPADEPLFVCHGCGIVPRPVGDDGYCPRCSDYQSTCRKKGE